MASSGDFAPKNANPRRTKVSRTIVEKGTKSSTTRTVEARGAAIGRTTEMDPGEPPGAIRAGSCMRANRLWNRVAQLRQRMGGGNRTESHAVGGRDRWTSLPRQRGQWTNRTASL